MKLKGARRLSYEDQRNCIREFLLSYDDYDATALDSRYGRKKYMIRLVIIHLFSKPSPTRKPTLCRSTWRTSKASSAKRKSSSWSKALGKTLPAILTFSHMLPTRSCPSE